MTKLAVNYTVMIKHNCTKFEEIHPLSYDAVCYFYSYSRTLTEAIVTKPDKHHCVMVIHIKYKFHRVPFIEYLVTNDFVIFQLILCYLVTAEFVSFESIKML